MTKQWGYQGPSAWTPHDAVVTNRVVTDPGSVVGVPTAVVTGSMATKPKRVVIKKGMCKGMKKVLEKSKS